MATMTETPETPEEKFLRLTVDIPKYDHDASRPKRTLEERFAPLKAKISYYSDPQNETTTPDLKAELLVLRKTMLDDNPESKEAKEAAAKYLRQCDRGDENV